MKLSQNAKNAVKIGTFCSVAYFAVYITRNVLGTVTPQLLEKGFTEEYIGSISSVFFTVYALGQLVNGIIGDKIKSKWMISIGLIGAAITNYIFSIILATPAAAMVAYGLTGFFLSMIYSPMMKVISENTEPLHATRCSLGNTFATNFGSPAAGLLAAFLTYGSVFTVSSAIMLLMGVLIIVFFSIFERQKIIQYGKHKPIKGGGGSIKSLLKRDIVKFSLISILTGIVRTSVVFWLPTYFNKYLGFSPDTSTVLFTVASLVISATAFIAVFIYERLGYNMNLSVLVFFIASVVFFLLAYFVAVPELNIICMILAIMASNSASTMLWSRYCPSLRDTGMVSTATGFLNFLSYMAASVANSAFATAATDIGWGNLILVWAGLMVIGVLISLPYKKIISKISNKSRA